MAYASSRSPGLLKTTTRSRIIVQKASAAHGTKRYLELASNENPANHGKDYPPWLQEAITPKLDGIKVVTADNPEDDIVNEEANAIRRPRAVQLAYLRPLKRQAKYRIPSCNLQLRSYSARNLEFFTTFALRAAYYLKLPAVGPVPLPKQVERWTVPRAHFVHKKSQENFERITMRRLIQIQDGHPETIQMWLAYLRKRQYYGVGMKANMWSFDKLGCGKDMDIEAERGQSLKERWEAQFAPDAEVQTTHDTYIADQPQVISQKTSTAKASTVATPSMRDSVNNLLSGTTDFDEALVTLQKSMKDLEMLSNEHDSASQPREAKSQSQKVEQILKEIELDAAEAVRIERQGREPLSKPGDTQLPHRDSEIRKSDSPSAEGNESDLEARTALHTRDEADVSKNSVESSSFVESSVEAKLSKVEDTTKVIDLEVESIISSAAQLAETTPDLNGITAEEKLPTID